VIEQKHFTKPTFTTAWGVCDEDLFMRGIEELRALNGSGRPFLATFMSVSNHKPYTYPKGRIAEDPAKQKRSHAVKYSDYALGQFFKAARKEAFWTNTIFIVVADHGARVYGSQTIPIHSYEVPLLIAGPAVVKTPSRMAMLGCLLDVAPTVLGLLGRPYESMFFGRDLLKEPGAPSRVLINHNRDIGLYAQERLVVLGLMKNVEFYRGDPKVVNMERSEGGALEAELEKDAAAFFQVADDLYMHRRYRVDP
jgi:phosphoglycerol transferase MdoB-like AlkP superfamily enzyme